MIENFAEIILDNLPDALYAVNNKGEIVIWNKQIEKLTGISKKDAIGKGNYEYSYIFYGIRKPCLIDILLNSNDKSIKKMYENFKRDGNIITGERKINGKEKYLQCWAAILYDNSNGDSIIGEVVTVKDITHSKELEHNFTKIFKHSPDPILITDVDSNIIDINDAFTVFTGYTLNKIQNMKINAFDLLYSNNKLKIINDLKLTGKIKQEYVIIKRIDNICSYGILSSTSTYINSKKCIITIIKDITQQKKLENNLQKVIIDKNKKFNDMIFEYNKEIREKLDISQTIIKTLNGELYNAG